MCNHSDSELMRLVKAGRQEAFVALVHRHQQSLLNFFRRMGAYTDEAEDLAQEVFLRLFNYRSRYRPSAKFTTFLYTLARHARADMMRISRRWPEAGAEISSDSAVTDHEHVLQADTQIDMQSALDRLSEKLRMVVVLSIYQGFRYREIAEVLGIPLGTVKSRMYLALEQLREILNVKETAG